MDDIFFIDSSAEGHLSSSHASGFSSPTLYFSFLLPHSHLTKARYSRPKGFISALYQDHTTLERVTHSHAVLIDNVFAHFLEPTHIPAQLPSNLQQWGHEHYLVGVSSKCSASPEKPTTY